MIEKAAQLQAKDLSWVGNLYRQRLQQLQKTKERYDQWLKEQNGVE
jgi:flagellar motility protein MotE (MotC chaperone)